MANGMSALLNCRLCSCSLRQDLADAGGIDKLPKPDKRMLEIAERIIEPQEGAFDPSKFKDRCEDAVRDLIARKKKGRKLTTPTPVEKDDGKVVDLMDALRRSLEPRGGAKERAERFRARKKVKTAAKPRTIKRSA